MCSASNSLISYKKKIIYRAATHISTESKVKYNKTMNTEATSSKPLSKFKCNFCEVIPSEDEINQCSAGHIICCSCSLKMGFVCIICGSENLSARTNPLVQIVKSQTKIFCKYKENGCSWLFSAGDDVTDHTSECKFRPYKCIGVPMNVWRCAWQGTQQDLADHTKSVHECNGEFFKYWHQDSIPFDISKTATKINLIDAFNKKFVFFYLCHKNNANVVFLIYLIGRKCDAQKYVLDFELKQDCRKLKFVENCYSDADDLTSVINQHRCVVVPKKSMQTYERNGHVQFRFVLKRKELIEEENAEKSEYLEAHILNGRKGEATTNDGQKNCEPTKPFKSNLMQSQPRWKSSIDESKATSAGKNLKTYRRT